MKSRYDAGEKVWCYWYSRGVFPGIVSIAKTCFEDGKAYSLEYLIKDPLLPEDSGVWVDDNCVFDSEVEAQTRVRANK